MEFFSNKIWLPVEWQTHANSLLRERYTSANYITIPDLHNGDGGLEGFSMDGNAYQMYCPENAMTVQKLFEDQRDKMTRDINKFINNKKEMEGFFGNLKIKRWILVVPSHQSSKLIAHATKKTLEVIQEKLSYVDNEDFRVLVWDQSEFKKEEASLLSAGLATLKLGAIDVAEHDINGYHVKSSEFSDNMKRKLRKLNNNPVVIKRGQDSLTKSVIISQNMMSELKQDYSEIHEQITQAIAKRAKQLDIEALDCDPDTQRISYQTGVLLRQFQDASKLHIDNLEEISKGTVADWLMNCTLDFN